MIANRVLVVLIALCAWFVVPIQIFTTFILGLVVELSFGLLLLPVSIIWVMLLFSMLAISYLAGKSVILREVLGFLFLPLALLAFMFVAFMPSMGEIENRTWKLMACETWPFTWDFWRYTSDPGEWTPSWPLLYSVLKRVASDPIRQRVLTRIEIGEGLDPKS